LQYKTIIIAKDVYPNWQIYNHFIYDTNHGDITQEESFYVGFDATLKLNTLKTSGI